MNAATSKKAKDAMRLKDFNKERLSMKKNVTTLLAASFLGLLSLPAAAAEHIVNMLNKGSDGSAMVFEPTFVRAAVGDTVKFVPVDKGHFVVTLPGMWPEGVEPAKGAINKEFVLNLGKDGVYGFKCTPHFAMGMVALVQVGNAPITDETKALNKKLPPLAQKRMTAAFELASKP
jgi:pseudoazurin